MYSSINETYQCTHQYISKIMNTQIHTRIASDTCPDTEEKCKLAASHQVPCKECNPPSISCMRGREAVSSSSISLYHMNHRGDRIIQIAWTHSTNHRFQQPRGSLVAKDDEQYYHSQRGENHLRREVLEHHEQKAHIKWYPHKAIGKYQHKIIPKAIVHTIEKQKNLCIYLI